MDNRTLLEEKPKESVEQKDLESGNNLEENRLSSNSCCFWVRKNPFFIATFVFVGLGLLAHYGRCGFDRMECRYEGMGDTLAGFSFLFAFASFVKGCCPRENLAEEIADFNTTQSSRPWRRLF